MKITVRLHKIYEENVLSIEPRKRQVCDLFKKESIE